MYSVDNVCRAKGGEEFVKTITVDEMVNIAIQAGYCVDAGYFDMNGQPLYIGDNIVYHHKSTRKLSRDENINMFPKDYIVGTGELRYVYTGRITKYKGKIVFNSLYGVDIELPHRFKWWKFEDNNRLLRVEKVVI